MQVTIYSDTLGMLKIRDWINHEMKGHFSYPNNTDVVLVKESNLIPDWAKKQLFNDHKSVGANVMVGGHFYVGKFGEWVAVDDNGVVMMGGQFHELQYFIKMIQNGGNIVGWKYHDDEFKNVNCAPWEVTEKDCRMCESSINGKCFDQLKATNVVIEIPASYQRVTNSSDFLVV